MPEHNENQTGKSDEREPRPPREDPQTHASGEGKHQYRPRSTRDPSTDPTRCGFYGGKRTDGKLCVGPVVKGTKRCQMHAGVPRRQAKAKGAVVTELEKWGLDGHTTHVDPGELLLRLLSQSAWRAEKYASLVARAYEACEAGESFDNDIRSARVGALIGYRYGVDKEGNRYPIEEAIRGLVQLEMQERVFARDTAKAAVGAGLAERQIRILEQQGTLIVELLRRVQNALDLTPEQTVRYSAVVSQELRALAG